MNDQILDSPITPVGELNYAGFWVRVAAVLIDSIILVVAIGIVAGISFAMLGDQPEGLVGVLIIAYGLAFIGGLLYYVLMESSSKQGTLGKIAMGIKVGKQDGERITAVNALGRLLARWLSGAIFYIGYIMVAFDAKKQGLHDKLANTYVFYSK